MINKKLISKWCDALISRKYKQTTLTIKQKIKDLKYEYGHCCLGVLCDIVKPTGWGKEFNELEAMPPDFIFDKIGLDINEVSELVEKNDNGKKFYEIARYLRRKYL